MHLSDQIHPTREQFKQLTESYPKDTPVSMLNILRFKTTVPDQGKSGMEVYKSYMDQATPFIKKYSGRLIWKGDVHTTFIGDSRQEPQVVFIVTYPTVEHFTKMVTDPDYLEVAKLRTMSIEYGGLFAMQQQYPL